MKKKLFLLYLLAIFIPFKVEALSLAEIDYYQKTYTKNRYGILVRDEIILKKYDSEEKIENVEYILPNGFNDVSSTSKGNYNVAIEKINDRKVVYFVNIDPSSCDRLYVEYYTHNYYYDKIVTTNWNRGIGDTNNYVIIFDKSINFKKVKFYKNNEDLKNKDEFCKTDINGVTCRFENFYDVQRSYAYDVNAKKIYWTPLQRILLIIILITLILIIKKIVRKRTIN